MAGWILGYLVEALSGSVHTFRLTEDVSTHHTHLLSAPLWTLSFHFLFMLLSVVVLYLGVRDGIEKGNKIMMPLLFFVLIALMIRGLTLPKAIEGLGFLLKPDWSSLSPSAFIAALGHAFFTLSLGQGTMVTYGSYLDKKENVLKCTFPVVLADTAVSLFATIAVFTIVFSCSMQPDCGPSLIFKTLPLAFSQMIGGYIIACVFFLLVFLAALSSQISAMEPVIAYLIDEMQWSRKLS